MQLRLVVLATLLAFAVVHAAGGDGEATYAADSPVHVLDESNFEDKIKSLGKAVLVEFFAPWCGHCKHLKPIYEEAARLVKERGDLSAALAAVDATVSRSLSEKFGVQGFPTVKLFKEGKEAGEYQGGRTADAIVAFLEQSLLPAVSTVDSYEQVETIRKLKPVVVVGHFSKENAPAQKALHEAADKYKSELGGEHVRFIEVTSAVAARLDMAATPAVKVFRNFPNVAGEPSTAEFDFFTESGFNTEMVFDFLKTETFPTLAEITPENYGQYEKRGLPFVWIFVPGRGKSGGTSEEGPVENTPEEAAQQQKILDTCRAVANKFRSKISFVYLSAIDYQQHAESLGLNLDTLPAILLNEQSDDGKKFLFNGSFSEESFAVFVQNYLDGKLAPFRKSEPAPASNDGPVKVVVADTFDALVWDNDKDVFIEFYAPWCQHCKRLEPLWNEIGELLKQKSDKIIIAKIDATANDVPAEVQGFPTLYFKKKGAAKGKLDKEMFYEGDRTKQAILRYIKEKSSADLSDLAIPADVERIRSFIGDLDRIKDELTRLLDENARLKKQVGAADGSPHDDAGFPADSLKQEGHDEL